MGGIFSTVGRIGRVKYIFALYFSILYNLLMFFLMGFIISLFDLDSDRYIEFFVGYFILCLPATIAFAFATVKRLHDIGRPGEHYWLFVIPFYNIYLLMVLFFKGGDPQTNQYGPA